MANLLNQNPMILTGSTATSYKSQTAGTLGAAPKNLNTVQGTLLTLVVEKLYWENPATIGDLILIGDPISGLELARLRCEVAGQSQVLDWSANPKIWQDFEINTFGSGTLYIYTR